MKSNIISLSKHLTKWFLMICLLLIILGFGGGYSALIPYLYLPIFLGLIFIQVLITKILSSDRFSLKIIGTILTLVISIFFIPPLMEYGLPEWRYQRELIPTLIIMIALLPIVYIELSISVHHIVGFILGKENVLDQKKGFVFASRLLLTSFLLISILFWYVRFPTSINNIIGISGLLAFFLLLAIIQTIVGLILHERSDRGIVLFSILAITFLLGIFITLFSPISFLIFFILALATLLFLYSKIKKRANEFSEVPKYKKNMLLFINHDTKKLFLTIISVFIFLAGVIIFVIIFSQSFSPRKNTYQNTSAPQLLQPPSPLPSTTPNFNNRYTSPFSLKNMIIYRYNNMLFASDFEGKNRVKLIDDNDPQDFIGMSNDKTILFFAITNKPTTIVYKKNFSSQETTPLFSIENISYSYFGKGPDPYFHPNISIDKEGENILYTSDGSLFLYDIAQKKEKKILEPKECPDPRSTPPPHASKDYYIDCYHFSNPKWSPTDKQAIIEKTYYEGSTYELINPFDNKIIEKPLQSGSVATWSWDGTMIMVSGGNYGPRNLYLTRTFGSPENMLTDINKFKNKYSENAILSSDNQIVFSYEVGINGTLTEKSGTALYNITTKSLKSIPPLNNYSLQSWLPDNQTILYTDENKNLWTMNITEGTQKQMSIKADFIIIQ